MKKILLSATLFCASMTARPGCASTFVAQRLLGRD